jgi:hypothetical protein
LQCVDARVLTLDVDPEQAYQHGDKIAKRVVVQRWTLVIEVAHENIAHRTTFHAVGVD